MDNTIISDAHAVFLPIFTGLELGTLGSVFLANGGKAILAGQTNEEYSSREMTSDRVAKESREDFLKFTESVYRTAGSAILAVDQELGGLTRLHNLVPSMPTTAEALAMGYDELVASVRPMAAAARELGVNMFLSPVLDYKIGTNPWLNGRLVSSDPHEVGHVGAAFVRGVKAEGIAATAKHFPGYCRLDGDPASEDVSFAGTNEQLEAGYAAFEKVFAEDVDAVMNGPAIVEFIDKEYPPSCSTKAVSLLRNRFRFTGLIISDDLDSRSTIKDGTIQNVAVRALQAGADLMIVPCDEHLQELPEAVVRAVERGVLSRQRLADAAANVRRTADRLCSTPSRGLHSTSVY